MLFRSPAARASREQGRRIGLTELATVWSSEQSGRHAAWQPRAPATASAGPVTNEVEVGAVPNIPTTAPLADADAAVELGRHETGLLLHEHDPALAATNGHGIAITGGGATIGVSGGSTDPGGVGLRGFSQTGTAAEAKSNFGTGIKATIGTFGSTTNGIVAPLPPGTPPEEQQSAAEQAARRPHPRPGAGASGGLTVRAHRTRLPRLAGQRTNVQRDAATIRVGFGARLHQPIRLGRCAAPTVGAGSKALTAPAALVCWPRTREHCWPGGRGFLQA